ncbi:hypothetical protein NFI96_018042, partial [Prochilodus magdalenae]
MLATSPEMVMNFSVLQDQKLMLCVERSTISKKSPSGSLPPKEREGILIKMKNAVSGYMNGVALCKDDVKSKEPGGVKDIVKQSLAQPTLDEHVAALSVEPSLTLSIHKPPQAINRPSESTKVASQDAVKSQMTQERMKMKLSAGSLPKPTFHNTSQLNRRNTAIHFRRKPFRRARKAKSKWWSNAKYSKPPPVIPPLDVSLRPDLEDVEGMLFVSFAAKKALDVHVQNMKHVETLLPSLSEAENQSDTREVEDVYKSISVFCIDCDDLDVSLSVEERISKLESILLLYLKQQKHRQVIHPLLQEVGIKLNLLDPTAAIDLQYLGVRLPFPPPIHNSLDQMNTESTTPSHEGAVSFVSRTGKTNDPTKIKGWRDKFNTKTGQSAPEGLRNHSAFCSDMLDEYLENEAQQISDRVAVFSKSFSTPVSYQLPSKSSSYVVTLDSLLKTRSAPLNRIHSNHAYNTQAKAPLRRSPQNSVPFCSEGSSYTTFGKKGEISHFAHSFQGDQTASSTGPPSRLGRNYQARKPLLRGSYGMTPAKTHVHFMLQDMEEEAFFNGKLRTHITNQRANFALNSLLTSQKSLKRSRFNTYHHDNECTEDFCRLGCICDSLQRKIRGPTHCRREQCMFDCNCFKHKVLLIHPPKVTKVQRGRRKALMAFRKYPISRPIHLKYIKSLKNIWSVRVSIADPEKGDRPPPATSVTTLWKLRTREHDSEPVYVPQPAPSFKKVPRMRTYVPRPTPQNHCLEAVVPPTSQKTAGNAVVLAQTVPSGKSTPLIDNPNKPSCKKTSRIFPLLTHAVPAGYLKAAKRKPGGPAQGLIRVNGKLYNQAKLLLGQMGALHPANRFAAFVTGRLRPRLQDPPKVFADVLKPCLTKAPAEPNAATKTTSISQTTPPMSSRPLPAIAAKTKSVSKRTRSKLNSMTALSTPVESPGTTPLLSPGSKLVNAPVPPANSLSTNSGESTTTGALPPGQQVILQQLPGVPGSNIFCQYNGQIIHLVPIASGPIGQPQSCLNNSEGSSSQVIQTANTCQPKDSKSVLKPLHTTSPSNALPRPFPVIAPKILSLSGSSGMNIASGTPAFNLQSSFPGKTGTFSFRICPPTAEGKAVGSQQRAKPPDQLVAAPSALVLPGGFTLIKLPLGPSVPAMPTDSSTPTSIPVELPQKDECKEEVISPSCSLKTEQESQPSESNTNISEMSNSSSTGTNASGLSHGKISDVGEDMLAEKNWVDKKHSVNTESKTTASRYDWVPEGAEMVLKSDDDCELEDEDMDDWPPKGAERVLWIEEDSNNEEENEDLKEQLNNNIDVNADTPVSSGPLKLKTSEADAKQKQHMTLQPKDEELGHEDCSHRNACELSPNGFSVPVKTEPNDKPIQSLSGHPCNINKEVLIQVNGFQTPIQTELYKEPTHKELVTNQPDICEKGLPENSSPVVSKREGPDGGTLVNSFSNHIDIQEQETPGNSGNTGPKNILSINKQATENPTETVSNHSDHSKQNLNCDSSEVIDHKELSRPSQVESLLSTSCYTSAEDRDDDDDDDDDGYVDIDGDVSCPLLEGQTPTVPTIPVERLSNTVSKKTDPRGFQSSSEINKVQPEFDKQMDNCSSTPITAKQREGGDVFKKNKRLWFQKADQNLSVDEDDVTNVHFSDKGEPGDDSDSDINEDSSNEEYSSSDEDNSSNDSESTSHSETTEDSANTSSKEDDTVDIETFKENQEKRIISKMKADVRQSRELQGRGKRADVFRKQLQKRDRVKQANELTKRLTHTEKERVRRGEMRQSFVSLKTALNVEEQMKMCKHDILIQARLMIRALEERNRTLKERKKTLLQRQSAYIGTIAQLSGKTEEMVKTKILENHERENSHDLQNLVPSSVTSLHRQLDSEDNPLPPQLGQWNKTSNMSSGQPSVTPTARKRKELLNLNLKKDCEQKEWFDVQNPIPTSASTPQINPRRLDREGNRFPPHLGLWNPVNYIRERTKKSDEQPSFTTADESSDSCTSSPVSPSTHATGPLTSVRP